MFMFVSISRRKVAKLLREKNDLLYNKCPSFGQVWIYHISFLLCTYFT